MKPPPSNRDVPTIWPAGVRRLFRAGVLFVGLALLAGALTSPFSFESPSLWYKFGIDKTLLRAGKMVGLAAVLLTLLQLPLVARIRWLEQTFPFLNRLRQHRWHAWALSLLALLHPILVRLPEDNLLFPLEMRYWPEWSGVGLLALILIQLASAQWRQRVGLAFHRWLPAHRLLGGLIGAGAIVHILFVSETFAESGPPRTAVWLAAGGFMLFWAWARSGWLRARRTPWIVSRVEPVATDCICVEIASEDRPGFDYLPGQFALVSFDSAGLSAEPHPFTLSSTPTRPESLQFTIRACGDWTARTGNLKAGERAWLQGPMGNFSYLLFPDAGELILIAGGVGITPMLSMLRFMADRQERRPITLVWSNRSPSHTPFADEVADLAARLTGLRHVPIFTANADHDDPAARLNRRSLEAVLSGCSRQAHVFICGPPSMMRQLKRDLKALGFVSRRIHHERFGF